MNAKEVNVAIGFATGRRNFVKIVRTYAENWHESGLVDDKNVKLNMFVAYDLKYKNTKPDDYRNIDERTSEILGSQFYIGEKTTKAEAAMLISSGVITKQESELLFGEGYAKKRNIIMYFALKNNMDHLLYLDDDEYPVAALRGPHSVAWMGQKVLSTHLKAIENADISFGYHCGYISPIPTLTFDDDLSENDFKLFIETISNDILSWDSIREKMRDGGVTYADFEVLSECKTEEIGEINGAKFISGSNLLINLKTDKTLYPFFNPPGARGEDTFLSTCLSEHRVIKAPCYTFHDGFSRYHHLLCGVLPERLGPVKSGSREIDERFLRACIGWIRYKPLFTYIVNRENYGSIIREMKENLGLLIPKLSRHFNNEGFSVLQKELEYYSNDVTAHFKMFEDTKTAWKKVYDYLRNRNEKFLSRAVDG